MSVLQDENGKKSIKRLWLNRSYWMGHGLCLCLFIYGFIRKDVEAMIWSIAMTFSAGGLGVGFSVLEKFRKKKNDK